MSLERLIDAVEDHAATCRQLGASEPGRSVAYSGAVPDTAGNRFLVSVLMNTTVLTRGYGRSLEEAAAKCLHEFRAWSELALQELREEREADQGIANLSAAAAKLGIVHRDMKPSNVIPLRTGGAR